jgi:hypothetical protein
LQCLLFNICLSLFLEQDSKVGRVVALDEAHKYMGASPESQTLTNSLLETIRLQRHLGARVFISTQEPTISPKLLDLCSVTIVHRFTSPDWLVSLKNHLAGVSSASTLLKAVDNDESGGPVGTAEGLNPIVLDVENPALALFSRIVGLRVGEALLFAPSAVTGVVAKPGQLAEARLTRLSHGVLKVRVRNRITQDGGRSILAA